MSDRWFTSTPVEVTTLPGRFTALEERTYGEILTFARDQANAGHELLQCLDADGTRVFDRCTGFNEGPLTDVMKTAMSGNVGVRLWHNHPSKDSLSHTDWMVASTSDQVEILALNEAGSVFVGRVSAWDGAYQHLFETLPRIAADLEFKMSRLAKGSAKDIDLEIALSGLTGHILNMALAESGAAAYAYWLAHPDLAAIVEMQDVVDDGMTFAVAEIRKIIASERSQLSGT